MKKMFYASFAAIALILNSYAQAQEENDYLSIAIKDDVKVDMRNIAAGTFKMGGNRDVRFDKDYYIGKSEVTQAQWQAVMGNNPSFFKGAVLPVECVSWNDAVEFCKKLNTVTEGKRPAGYEFSLPTEVQWEFAARGGAKSKNTEYSGSDKNSEVAIFYDNSPDGTKPVCQKKPNELGLYDMSGNVWEWCLDVTTNGGETTRISRGGCWLCAEVLCTVGIQCGNMPDCRVDGIGFRLALVPTQK